MGFLAIVFLFVIFAVISSVLKGGRARGSHTSHRANDPTNMWGGDQQQSLNSSTTDFSTHDSGSHTHHHHHDHGHHDGGHHGGHDSGGFGGGDAGGGHH